MNVCQNRKRRSSVPKASSNTQTRTSQPRSPSAPKQAKQPKQPKPKVLASPAEKKSLTRKQQYVCMCISACLYVCMYVYVCMCMHVYVLAR